MNSWSLDGKTALVCGASGGIGEAAARLFAERGARVIALARSAEKLQAMIASLPGSGHSFITCDLADIAAIKSDVVPQISKANVHILVNNTGGPKGGPLYKADISEFETPVHAHIMASHLLVQTVLPSMQAAGYGRIINVISTSVKTPIPGLGVSNTIRGAMASWSKTLAGELAPFGVTVNNVLPGYIKTDRLKSLMGSSAQTNNVSLEQAEENFKATVPMGRIGDPREIAEAMAFLASPAASYITGIHLPVDGGRTPAL
jgi:Dehydrogenases with different specificities (related to short-chain alcohol dehydrogenases)